MRSHFFVGVESTNCSMQNNDPDISSIANVCPLRESENVTCYPVSTSVPAHNDAARDVHLLTTSFSYPDKICGFFFNTFLDGSGYILDCHLENGMIFRLNFDKGLENRN